MQDEIAGLIARNLSLKLGAMPKSSPVAVTPEAFELYLQGRQAWNKRSAEGFARAEQPLNRAIQLSPDCTRAHAALADVALGRAWANGAIGDLGSAVRPCWPGLSNRSREYWSGIQTWPRATLPWA